MGGRKYQTNGAWYTSFPLREYACAGRPPRVLTTAKLKLTNESWLYWKKGLRTLHLLVRDWGWSWDERAEHQRRCSIYCVWVQLTRWHSEANKTLILFTRLNRYESAMVKNTVLWTRPTHCVRCRNMIALLLTLGHTALDQALIWFRFQATGGQWWTWTQHVMHLK